MNKWQIAFLVLGILILALLIGFPPQITVTKDVRFLPITDGYPIDWLRFMVIALLDIFITGLGLVVNKSEHF